MSSAHSRKPTKRQELGARSRDEILNAALRMMSIYGYEGTSVARIASESGLPSSSIYWHFASKAGVLTAVMQRGADRFFAESGNYIAIERETVSARDLFRDGLRNSAIVADANPEFLKLLFLLTLSGEHDATLIAVLRSVTDRGIAQLRSIIEFAFAEHGEDKAKIVADRLVIFAQGVFDGSFIATQTHPGVNHVDLVEKMADAILALGDTIIAELS